MKRAASSRSGLRPDHVTRLTCPGRTAFHRLRAACGRVCFASLVALLLSGCGNMKDQANPRAMEPSRHFAGGTTAQPPPAHTVARDAPPAGDPMLTGFAQGKLLAKVPIPYTRELLVRGRERFDIYCAVCHGADGYGTGIVVRRGFPPPPSYHDDRLRSVEDGHLFDVMTRGYGVMPSYADRIAPRDRWAIVAYIRALQRSQHATLADVPPEARHALEAP